MVTHLPRIRSDHSPILVNCQVDRASQGSRPFRFQAAWLTHPRFKQVVESTWSQDTSLCDNIKMLTATLGDWNKTSLFLGIYIEGSEGFLYALRECKKLLIRIFVPN